MYNSIFVLYNNQSLMAIENFKSLGYNDTLILLHYCRTPPPHHIPLSMPSLPPLLIPSLMHSTIAGTPPTIYTYPINIILKWIHSNPPSHLKSRLNHSCITLLLLIIPILNLIHCSCLIHLHLRHLLSKHVLPEILTQESHIISIFPNLLILIYVNLIKWCWC